MIMPKSSKLPLKIMLSLAVTGLPIFAVPAQAYNLSFGNVGYSMLYPLTNLAYGPYYILNRVMMQNVYSPYGYSPYGGRYAGFGNSQYGYNNLNNLSGNQNFNGQNGNQGMNAAGNYSQQQNYTQPANYNQQTNYQQQGNLSQPLNQSNHGAYNPSDPFATGQQANYGAAGVAPIDPINGRTQAPNSSQYLAAGGSNQPATAQPSLAPNRLGGTAMPPQGAFGSEFLDVISNKYHGDVSRAFKDNDVRAWAQALNLQIPEGASLDKMGHVRKQAIQSVLKDNSLDTPNKIEALRILLH
jgi:hypothetical protein